MPLDTETGGQGRDTDLSRRVFPDGSCLVSGEAA
jgi:hypothetical protein